MNTTVKSLQDLYVKLGGSLTDTYEGIAGGSPVGEMSLIPDIIAAVTEKAGSGGGSDAESGFASALIAAGVCPTSATDASGVLYWFLPVRQYSEMSRGAMENATISHVHDNINYWTNGGQYQPDNQILKSLFYSESHQAWGWDDLLLALAKIESDSAVDWYKAASEVIDEYDFGETGGGYNYSFTQFLSDTHFRGLATKSYVDESVQQFLLGTIYSGSWSQANRTLTVQDVDAYGFYNACISGLVCVGGADGRLIVLAAKEYDESDEVKYAFSGVARLITDQGSILTDLIFEVVGLSGSDSVVLSAVN